MSRIGHWVWEARLLFKCFNLRNWSQQRVHWPHGKDSSHWGTNWSTRHWFYLMFVYIYTSYIHPFWAMLASFLCTKSICTGSFGGDHGGNHCIYDLRSVSKLQIFHSTDSGTCCQFILLQPPPMRSNCCICNWKQGTDFYPTPIFSYFLAMNSWPWHTMAINYRISRMGSLVFHLGIHMAPTPPWWGRGRQMPRPPVVKNLGFDTGFMWCWTLGLKWFRMVQSSSKWFKMV